MVLMQQMLIIYGYTNMGLLNLIIIFSLVMYMMFYTMVQMVIRIMHIEITQMVKHIIE